MALVSASTANQSELRRGALYGLTAAVLFGMSAPIAKVLLPSSAPIVLAALFYLGAAVALSGARLIGVGRREARVLDNNLTQRLSVRNPAVVMQMKTLGAGAGSVVIALIAGAAFPPAKVSLVALLVGAVSYGVSL